MSAEQARVIVAGLILILLSGCIGQKPEIEEKEISLGYRGLAKVKPFLAAMRFLEARGIPVEECFSLARLPEPDVGLLLPAEADRSASSAERLLEWISEGGHLIYLLRGGDSFTNDFADEWKWDDEEEVPEKPGNEAGITEVSAGKTAGDPGSEAAARPEKAKETGQKGLVASSKQANPLLKALSVKVVERRDPVNAFRMNGRVWKAEIPAGHGFRVLQTVTGTDAVHAAGQKGRRAFLSFPSGEGRVTLVADAKLWRNRYIGAGDHAGFLWEVVGLCPDVTKVWVVRSTRVSLFELVRKHGRRVVLSLGLLLLVWLWWATRRFGPRLPDPEGESREFGHYLDMSGSFLWRRRASAALAGPVRRRIRARHGLQESGPKGGAEPLAQLVRKSGLDESVVRSALWGELPREARPFTELMKQLQILDSLK